MFKPRQVLIKGVVSKNTLNISAFAQDVTFEVGTLAQIGTYGSRVILLPMFSPPRCIPVLSPSKAVSKLRISKFMKAAISSHTEVAPDVFHATKC